VEPPGKELVESYLSAIANAYDVRYGDEGEVESADVGGGDVDGDENDEDDDQPSSGGRALANPRLPAQELTSVQTTPPRNIGPRSPISVAPPSPSTLNPNPRVRLPDSEPRPPVLKPNARMKGVAALNGSALSKSKPEGDIPDVDDLEQRFAMLKK